MINEEWKKKTQNDAPFVAFYNICAVTFVLPDENGYVLIAGLPVVYFIPQLNHTGSHRPSDSHSNPYLEKENKTWNKNPQPATILRNKRKAVVCHSF